MPELEGRHQLTDYLSELGYVGHGGMGATPLSWFEIESWANLTGLWLTPWESLTLRKMSCEYCSALSEYRGKAAPPPFEFEKPSTERLEASLDRIFDRVNASINSKRGRRGSRHNPMGH